MLFIVSACSGFAGSSELAGKFAEWKLAHGKLYETAEAERSAFAGFVHNDALIAEHNAKGLSYWLGHNEFSDLTFDEFRRKYGLGRLFTNRAPKNINRVHITNRNTTAPPGTVDWVAKGVVTGVKNEGRCASSWAFSAAGAIEGASALATGLLTSYSAEELLQCENREHGGRDMGCTGGFMDNAFEWVEKHGLCTEEAYPYTAGTNGTTGTCKKSCIPAVTVSKFTDVPSGDEVALQSAVAQQPVSIAVDASTGGGWQLYRGGVFDPSLCGKQNPDHAVLLVGYGAEGGKDYWTIKNTWGTSWGLGGYMHIVRGKNMCGLANKASYPHTKPYASETRAAPSKPDADQGTHFGDPKNGCLSDEVEVTVEGVQGDFCTSTCALYKPCPTDVPPGTSARPTCALDDDTTHQKYCALLCPHPEVADGVCPENASCKPSGSPGIGLCTYDD